MERSFLLRSLGAVIATSALAVGCSGTGSPPPEPPASPRSGPDATRGDEVVTLVLGNALVDMPNQLITWAVEVRERTGESIVFEVRSEYGTEDGDREQAVLDGVASGELDLGWVGARAVPAFEPLLAPLLVDSHALQHEVFAQGLAGRMMADMDIEGVTGLGVLPGPMRRLTGLGREFRSPADFDGAVLIADRNAAMVEALRALGAAEVRPGAEDSNLSGVDGLVGTVAIVGNDSEEPAVSVTTNLNFSPRPLLLLINTTVLDGLTPTHRSALLASANATLEAQIELTRTEDAMVPPLRDRLCSSPVELLELTETELTALETAVAPVHRRIAADPRSARHLAEIIAIKEGLGAPAEALSCDVADP